LVSPDPTDADSDEVADEPLLISETHVLGAQITHPDGLIEEVEVWINGRFAGQAEERTTLNVFEHDFFPVLLGQYVVTFRARDDLGNLSSSTLRYNVIAGSVPAVSILGPEDADNDGVADDTFVLG